MSGIGRRGGGYKEEQEMRLTRDKRCRRQNHALSNKCDQDERAAKYALWIQLDQASTPDILSD